MFLYKIKFRTEVREIISSDILFYNKEKSVTNSALFLENKEYPRVAQIYDFYSGAQNILSIFFKLVTSTALFGVFQGSLFLFVAYIPGNTYDIYC